MELTPTHELARVHLLETSGMFVIRNPLVICYRFGKVQNVIGERERKLRGSGMKDSLYQNSI